MTRPELISKRLFIDSQFCVNRVTRENDNDPESHDWPLFENDEDFIEYFFREQERKNAVNGRMHVSSTGETLRGPDPVESRGNKDLHSFDGGASFL